VYSVEKKQQMVIAIALAGVVTNTTVGIYTSDEFTDRTANGNAFETSERAQRLPNFAPDNV